MELLRHDLPDSHRRSEAGSVCGAAEVCSLILSVRSLSILPRQVHQPEDERPKQEGTHTLRP
jgi:hypothetical protein